MIRVKQQSSCISCCTIMDLLHGLLGLDGVRVWGCAIALPLAHTNSSRVKSGKKNFLDIIMFPIFIEILNNFLVVDG